MSIGSSAAVCLCVLGRVTDRTSVESAEVTIKHDPPQHAAAPHCRSMMVAAEEADEDNAKIVAKVRAGNVQRETERVAPFGRQVGA